MKREGGREGEIGEGGRDKDREKDQDERERERENHLPTDKH